MAFYFYANGVGSLKGIKTLRTFVTEKKFLLRKIAKIPDLFYLRLDIYPSEAMNFLPLSTYEHKNGQWLQISPQILSSSKAG